MASNTIEKRRSYLIVIYDIMMILASLLLAFSLRYDFRLPPEPERKVDFPSPPITDIHVIDASFIWHTKLGFIAVGWAGNLREMDNGSVYIKLQLINNISFNL